MQKPNVFQFVILFFAAILVLGLSACAASEGAAPEQSDPIDPAEPARTAAAPSGATAASGTADQAPQAVEQVRQTMLDRLGLSGDELQLRTFETRMWPNSCLGLPRQGEMCAQAVTPGFLIVFDTPTGAVEVHTDETGEQVRHTESSAGAEMAASEPLLEWTRSGGIAGVCERFTVYASGSYTLEDCKGSGALKAEGQAPEQDLQKLIALAARYRAFEGQIAPPEGSADMFSEEFTFYGAGSAELSNDAYADVQNFMAGLIERLRSEITVDKSGQSGLQGQIMIGPNCPGPVSVDNDCPDQPYQGEFVVFNAAGQEVARFASDANGNYNVSLPPGKYALRPVDQDAFPTQVEKQVNVLAGQFIEVNLSLDTGMR